MLGVPHRAVEVHPGVRHLAHEMDAGHDHPRHPEEEDLRAPTPACGRDSRSRRSSVWSGQPRLEKGTSQELNQVSSTSSSWRTGPPQPGQTLQVGAAHTGAAAPGRLAIPYRNAMPPPELAGDAPVADALQPPGVVFSPALGNELQGAVAVPGQGGAGERLHLHEPLLREAGLDHRPAAVAVSHRVPVRLRLDQQPGGLELRHHLAPRLEAVESLEPLRRGQAHPRLGGHHVDAGQAGGAGRSRSRPGRARG